MMFAAVAVLAAVSSASTGTAIPNTMTRDNTSVKSFFLSYFIVFPSFFMHKVFMKLLYALAGLSPCYCFSGHKKAGTPIISDRYTRICILCFGRTPAA